jgi:hypothetical protein
MNVHISDRGARLAMLGTQLDNETAVLTRLARERAKIARELKSLDLRINETVRVIGTLSDGIRHEGLGGV